MQREESLLKIAHHHLRTLTREQAEDIMLKFFKSPLKPSLEKQLNITVIAQWNTHRAPEDLNPGNPIYRPILVDHMRDNFKGATNEYLLHYLRNKMKLEVDSIEGESTKWLACPVCDYRTFYERGTWLVCGVCGWNSDPMQEAKGMENEPIGANGVSLNQARKNFAEFGLANSGLEDTVEPDGKLKYPRSSQ
ncbi:MAG: hypothetical protein B6242_13350 [Anaerolineaceae bacterium 4572_78]|nr:MAG: hypothetical protein B6242_13350 [Anaerolineaceae bacterium 4572_78]